MPSRASRPCTPAAGALRGAPASTVRPAVPLRQESLPLQQSPARRDRAEESLARPHRRGGRSRRGHVPPAARGLCRTWVWDGTADALTSVGHRVEALDLPSSGPDPAALGGLADDVATVTRALEGTGAGTVLVAHSGAGAVLG